MNHRARNPQSPGFSLVELLVVVAIILMLVATIMPSLYRAADCAQAAVCAANLRNVCAMMVLYVHDAKKFPPAMARQADGQVWYWIRLLFAADQTIPMCPAAPERDGLTFGRAAYGYNVPTFCWARGHEREIAGGQSYREGVVAMGMVKRPASTIMLGDCSHGWREPRAHYPAHIIDTPGRRMRGDYMADQYRMEAPTQRHFGEAIANLGYPDGHAAADGLATWDGSKQGAIWNYDLWVLGDASKENW